MKEANKSAKRHVTVRGNFRTEHNKIISVQNKYGLRAITQTKPQGKTASLVREEENYNEHKELTDTEMFCSLRSL